MDANTNTYNSNKSNQYVNYVILGGAFNPPTQAHIQIARYVFDNTKVTDIWLMPSANHLQKTGLESFKHRYNMCKIASNPFSEFVGVSDWELTGGLDGSTYDLINELNSEYTDASFSYIIGMDQVNNFHTWKNWEKLKDMVRFIVIPRLGVEPDPNITWYLEKPHIYLKDFPAVDTSSTRARELLKQPTREQKTLDKILGQDVFAYICDEELYE